VEYPRENKESRIVNLKTDKSLGIAIPESILLRADVHFDATSGSGKSRRV
jgi:hypothetical protein